MGFHEVLYLFSENLPGTFKLRSHLIRIAGTVPEGLCTLMIVSRLCFLRIRHVSEKKVYKEQNFMFNFFFPSKNESFMR